MRRKIRVIISTLGPLHLIKSAEYLSNIVDVRVIQGWIPSWWNKWLLYIASYIQKRDIFKTIKKRTPDSLRGKNVGIGLPDLYFWGCRFFKLTSGPKAVMNAALLYGKMQKRYLKEADIYHVRSGSGANGAIAFAKKKGMKVIVDHSIAHPAFMDKQLRDEYLKNNSVFELGLDNPFWRDIIQECKEGDVVLVNSQFVKDTFVENGFNDSQVKVVLLGVRSDFFNLKSTYSIDDKKLKILFTGGFGFRKGAEYILRALCKLDGIGLKYEMTVVGDYAGAMPIIKKYRPNHLKLVNTVPQEELKSYLRDSDVYLFPSLCEGCASSGMEAMAAGLPVISTRESGLPIENGIDGIVVEAKEVESIVEALQKVYNDRTMRETLGRNAAEKISKNYTWEKYAENVVAIYKELLNK